MLQRRLFLKSLLLGLAALPIPAGPWRGGAARAAPGFHLVNGWILTSRDLETLRKHDS